MGDRVTVRWRVRGCRLIEGIAHWREKDEEDSMLGWEARRYAAVGLVEILEGQPPIITLPPNLEPLSKGE